MGLKSKPLSAVRADVPVADVIKGDVVRVNINVPENTRMEWKIAAAQRKTDVTAMILESMSIYLRTHKSK